MSPVDRPELGSAQGAPAAPASSHHGDARAGAVRDADGARGGDEGATAAANAPAHVAALFEQACPGERVCWVQRTATRVDTGAWFRRPRLWIGVLEDQLVLAAWGPRPMTQALALDRLGGSTYNHVTGRLLLADVPASMWESSEPAAAVAVNPVEAQRLLQWIKRKDQSNG